jgi:excinuclease ABC subunit C
MSIRDEAHRFGITHHRGKRSTRQLSSQLSKINGVGPKTEEKLLLKFKSVARIKKASFEELSKEVGKSIAQAILDYFSGNS